MPRMAESFPKIGKMRINKKKCLWLVLIGFSWNRFQIVIKYLKSTFRRFGFLLAFVAIFFQATSQLWACLKNFWSKKKISQSALCFYAFTGKASQFCVFVVVVEVFRQIISAGQLGILLRFFQAKGYWVLSLSNNFDSVNTLSMGEDD